jgi:hypothetical protein
MIAEAIEIFTTILEMRSTVLATVLVAGVATGFSQFKNTAAAGSHTSDPNERPSFTDSLSMKPSLTDKYWIAGAEAAGSNLAVWGFFRYAEQESYSRISFKAIEDHLKTGFWWDEDGFLGNQFNHPYHGSVYFNSARSNGLGFWESALYAFGGSAMWELFMEVEPPSYNDIINTPVSGVIFGEITFRSTNLILDPSKRGFDRVLREASALLLNPVRGFNRVFSGEMWRTGSPSSNPDYKLWLSLGGNDLFYNRTIFENHGYGLARLDMEYGELMAASRHKDPFDYFSVRVEMGFSGNDDMLGIVASGVLWDKTVTLSDHSSSVLGIYKEFDLHNNLICHLTATSVAFRLTNVVPISAASALQSSVSISGVFMGGVNSQYASVYHEQYNMGPGASANVSTALRFQDFGSVYLNYKRFWLHTLNGADGDEFIGLLNLGTNYSVTNATTIGLDLVLYERYSIYEHFPSVNSAISSIHFYAKFRLG